MSNPDAIKNKILAVIEESISVKRSLINEPEIIGKIKNLADLCLLSLKAGGKIIFAGNGGSFADAQHLSAEFTSRFLFDRAPLASLVLGANNSAISAIGNDYGYEEVFARELRGVGKAGDVFIPISTSGNSENILAAAIVAKDMEITTMGWSGAEGGMLASLCDVLCVPSSETARIQECHILMGHILCELVEAMYFGGDEAANV
jgi:D-sedoheptulose 7-phosphate isomerase